MSTSLRFALLAGAACLAIGHTADARADTVDQTRARLAAVRHEVHRLDLHLERVDERYDAAVLRLSTLDRRIGRAARSLHREQLLLDARQAQLSQLLVASYKGQLAPDTLLLILGSSDVGDLVTSYSLKHRLDAAFAQDVADIAHARAAIAARRRALRRDRLRVAQTVAELDHSRRTIHRMLATRRRLAKSLTGDLLVAQAADRIGQAQLAVEARRWIRADARRNRRGGQVVVGDLVALDGLAQIGVPYRWGGASPVTGFDCSGLVTWLYARRGVYLPHYAAAQYADGAHVSESGLAIGDLVFFHNLRHVAIYLGHGYLLHAPHTGDVVRIAALSDGWFQSSYAGATRVDG